MVESQAVVVRGVVSCGITARQGWLEGCVTGGITGRGC